MRTLLFTRRSLSVGGFLLLALLAAPAPAQTTDPFLTLNTEMHTANINRISTDRRGRTLLTASDDKTAKLWDLATGTLLRTLRPPIGAGDEGMLYAGALSPDGSVAAIGGWTSKDGLNNNIYLFNAHNGELLRRISGLPNVINDLEFSPDGRYLAAGLGEEGIRIWRSADDGLQAQDSDYGADVYNLAFDAGGRLASVCEDGYLRLYGSDFKLLKKVKTTGGKDPLSLAFSPDARLLALGYYDSPTVQVLDANTLQVLYNPDIKGAETQGQRLVMLAFSADGTRLAAGGFYDLNKNGQSWRQIRIWNQAGRGTYSDVDAGDNTITDIKALSGGGFAYGGSQPDWGLIDPSAGQRDQYRDSELFSYRAKDKSHFHLGAEGSEVGAMPSGQSPFRFRLLGRAWAQTASEQPVPVAERNGIAVSDWSNSTAPKLNGKALAFLKQNERNRCVDIATGGQGIAFGTNWNLYYTDAAGQMRWRTPTQAPVYCVKIDAYNLVVATASSDGCIRWYRLSDGVLLLTLYPHPDQRRWVLWTPGGYYDCTPGAEELLGWHVNQGYDKAGAYYPLSQFRERYYRPDVIDLVLETLDEAKAVQQAAQATGRTAPTQRAVTESLPPTLRILSPSDGTSVSSTQITLEYSIQSADDAPVTAVRIQVDGRPVATERGFKPGKKQTATVNIPTTDCAVSIIAENKHGASSPATLRLTWAGSTSAAPAADLRPVLYVLAIGVGKYTHADLGKLDYSAKDARDFAAVLAPQKGLLYRDVQVRRLTDAEATKDAILDGLDWLQHQTTARDVAMLFFAGHGMDDNAGNFYFLPVGADPGRLRATAISHGEVQTTVASVPGKIVVFMDACHSGGVMRSINPNRRGGPDLTKIINELIAAENGGIVFSASTSRQYALESAAWNNGVFTKAVVEGLSGQAKTASGGKITWKSLDLYVSERVKSLTNGAQSPVAVGSVDVGDFPVSAVK